MVRPDAVKLLSDRQPSARGGAVRVITRLQLLLWRLRRQ